MSRYHIPFHEFDKTSRVVFFTGAGISAESGISTFRGLEGYWSKYDPTVLASVKGFRADPELVIRWYAERKKVIHNADPNPGHLAITQFQKLFPNSVVLTQNVDGLHVRAGNERVTELHGNIHSYHCLDCGAAGSVDKSRDAELHSCDCGGYLRPSVVWYGESLSADKLNNAFDAARACDILFTVGTSTLVYPAAQLPFEAKQSGAFGIEINPDPTPFSQTADISLRDPAGEALPKLYEEFYAALS